jgi:hypothetical protein
MAAMQVFCDPNGFDRVKSCLTKLGMDQGHLEQVSLVLTAIRDLLSGTRSTQALRSIGISKLPSEIPSENSLVHLLYAYLVQWIGECVGGVSLIIYVSSL